MRDLSHAIIGRTIFGADWAGHAAVLAPCADVFLDHTSRRSTPSAAVHGVGAVAHNRRWRRAHGTYDEVSSRSCDGGAPPTIRARTSSVPSARPTCRTARCVKTRPPPTSRASPSTSRLAWLWQLVAEHPEVGERLNDELAGLDGRAGRGRSATAHLCRRGRARGAPSLPTACAPGANSARGRRDRGPFDPQWRASLHQLLHLAPPP